MGNNVVTPAPEEEPTNPPLSSPDAKAKRVSVPKKEEPKQKQDVKALGVTSTSNAAPPAPAKTLATDPPLPARVPSESLPSETSSSDLHLPPLVSASLLTYGPIVEPLQPKVLHETDKDEDWPTFRLGLFLGINLVVFAENMKSVSTQVDGDHIDWSIATRLYRGSFLLTLFLLFLAINIHYWKRTGVAYVRIFEFKKEDHFATSDYLELTAFITCVWAFSLLCFLEYKHLNIPVFSSPLALLIFYIVFVFNPVHYFWYRGRIWFLKHMWRFLTSPFHKVGFADFWMADTMNTFTSVMLDFQYAVCIYTNESTLFLKKAASGPPGKSCKLFCHCNTPLSYIRPCIRFLPPLIRIIQCLRRYKDSKKRPHLYNMVKYVVGSLAILLTSLTSFYEVWFPKSHRYENVFLYIWLIVASASSCYSFYWDVRMDWGLFDPNPGPNRFLREDLVYSPRWLYYFAIVEDFFLRCAWSITFIITETGYTNSDIMVTIFAPLEMFRFFVWNFLRLENEHLNNCIIQFQEFADVNNFKSRRRNAIYDDREPLPRRRRIRPADRPADVESVEPEPSTTTPDLDEYSVNKHLVHLQLVQAMNKAKESGSGTDLK